MDSVIAQIQNMSSFYLIFCRNFTPLPVEFRIFYLCEWWEVDRITCYASYGSFDLKFERFLFVILRACSDPPSSEVFRVAQKGILAESSILRWYTQLFSQQFPSWSEFEGTGVHSLIQYRGHAAETIWSWAKGFLRFFYDDIPDKSDK